MIVLILKKIMHLKVIYSNTVIYHSTNVSAFKNYNNNKNEYLPICFNIRYSSTSSISITFFH